MRLFPADWLAFLDDVARWGEVSIEARRAFLDGIAPGLSVDAEAGGAAATELVEAGFLEDGEHRGRLGVPEDRAPFHQVMKSLGRSPLFEQPGLASLISYLGEHYSPQERSRLHESVALLPNDLVRVAGFVSSVEWMQSALERPAHGAEAAQQLLTFFTEQRDRVALRDLEEYFPGMTREELCTGLRLGIERCLFYLALRRADLEPLVGVWPAAVRRLRRLAVVLAPEPVGVGRVFRHPFLVEDLTSLLVAARASPIPVRRGDDRPFSRFVEEAAGMLLTLPGWMETMTGLTLEARISLALQAARLTGLLVAVQGAHLAPGPQAEVWLGRALEERAQLVVNRFAEGGERHRLMALLEEDWPAQGERDGDLLPWLQQAFSSVPAASYLRFSDFAEYQAALGGPLGVPPGPASLGPEASMLSEEAAEELWMSFLGVFLGRCLLSVAGAEAGLTEEGAPAFRLTETGRRLLGIPVEAVRPGAEPAGEEETPLVVQPNFEVVFLSPAPGAEAELGRFCDRVGREVGVLFRLSRQSLGRAASAGMTTEDVQSSLGRYSRSPLPANVAHEIGEWMRR